MPMAMQRRRAIGAALIQASVLSPQKARVLLMLALTRTQDPEEIQRMFEIY